MTVQLCDFASFLMGNMLAHRTMLVERRVLHRDMSEFNILIYPEWSPDTGTKVMDNAPPMIHDLLADKPR